MNVGSCRPGRHDEVDRTWPSLPSMTLIRRRGEALWMPKRPPTAGDNDEVGKTDTARSNDEVGRTADPSSS